MTGRNWARVCGLVLAAGAGSGVGVRSAQSGGAPPAEPALRPAAAAVLKTLSEQIARAENVARQADVVREGLDQRKATIRYYERELVRLSEKRERLEGQLAAARLAPLDPKAVAEAVESHPDFIARLRTMLDARTPDGRLPAEVTEAARHDLLALRAKLTPVVESNLRTRQAAQAELSRDGAAQREELATVVATIEDLRKHLRQAQREVMEKAEDLRKIGHDPDRLPALRAQRVAVETELLLQTVRGPAPASDARLDRVLAELQAIRAKLDAKP